MSTEKKTWRDENGEVCEPVGGRQVVGMVATMGVALLVWVAIIWGVIRWLVK